MALQASTSLRSASTRAQQPRPLARAAPRLARAAPARRCAAIVAQAAKAATPVKIILQGRRLEVTPAIKDYVEGKISRAVANYSGDLKHVDVTISARGGDTGTHGARQQKVDVTIHTVRNGVVRVEDTEASLYASIDLVADKVARKLQKVKERAIAKGKWSGRAGPRGADDTDFQEWIDSVAVEIRELDEAEARQAELEALERAAPGGAPEALLRSKVLRVDRMPVDDAIDAMEAVGHAFFLFRDTASGEVRVVYKRSAGGYGVLIPEASAEAN